MIEINLLPEELKTKAKPVKPGFNMESEYFLYGSLLILGSLILAHIYLTAFVFVRNNQLRRLNNKWRQLEPQRKLLENFNAEYTILSQDALALKKLTDARVNWSEKLNKLSLGLPSRIWFNEILVSSNNLSLRASAISLQNEEMNLIKKFIDNLKSDSGFFKDFNSLELSLVQRKVIGGYDIVDFTLVGAINLTKNIKSIEGQKQK